MNKQLALALLLATSASLTHAGKAYMDVTQESLKNGDRWELTGASFVGELPVGEGFKASARLEKETRRLGASERVYGSGIVPVGESSALEITLGAGSGAVYSMRNSQALTLYTGVGATELDLTLKRVEYPTLTIQRASVDSTTHLAYGFSVKAETAVNYAQGSYFSHSVGLGIGYEYKNCRFSLSKIHGRDDDLDFDDDDVVAEGPTQTTKVGVTCSITPSVDFSVKVLSTSADRLSREGVFVGLIFTY